MIQYGAEHVRVRTGSVRTRRPPPMFRRAGEFQNPAQHRHGDPQVGELRNERVGHFEQPPSFRFARDRYAAARRRTSFSCSRTRIRFFSSGAFAASVEVRPGRLPSLTPARGSQFYSVISLIPKSCDLFDGDAASRRRAIATTPSWNSLTRVGHNDILPSSASRHSRPVVTGSCLTPQGPTFFVAS